MNTNHSNSVFSTPSPATISVEALASVTGGYRINDTLDNANRWGGTGALLGAAVGALATPVGAGLGGTVAGAVGWLAGAVADSARQVNAGKPNRPTNFGHWPLH